VISTFFGIEIARRGLMASRNAMDVTAHNLANASTEGYTRQDPVFSATDPYTLPNLAQRLLPGQLGTGTEVVQIRRIRDALLDGQVRYAKGEDCFWQARQDALQRVEAVFPEPSEVGLESVLARFFDAWHELNNNPSDLGLKAVVKEAGEELAVNFRHIYRQLSDIRKSQEDLIKLKAQRINDIAGELGDLNKAIERIVANGNQPNDLLDKRDLFLDELAEIAQIETTFQNNGTVNVKISNSTDSVQLVSATGDFNHIDLNDLFDPTTDKLTLKIFDSLNNPVGNVDITDDAVAFKLPGSLAGAESARSGVKEYLDSLDQLAYGIAVYVNNLHHDDGGIDFFKMRMGTPTYGSAGYPDDPSNPLDDASDYLPYFDPFIDYKTYVEGYAASIDLESDIKTDANKINESKALAIAELRQQSTMADSTGTPVFTFEAFYRGLVSGIGADAQGSGHQAGTARAVLQQLENLRQSVSGVSLDEELTRLTQFQYAYQASARVMTALDSMLDTLINRMGVM